MLALICIGMFAFATWRVVAAQYDLEARGSDAKGLAARAAMIVSGLVHLGLGFAAFSLLFLPGRSSGSGDGSRLVTAVDAILGWPAGRWLVGLAGLAVIGAGIAYVGKAKKESYRKRLRASRFTRHWNGALRFGIAAHGLVIGIIGFLLVLAAWRFNASEAGGTNEAFAWLHKQAYGRVLVGVVCIGLLGFALFCFVNAAYRIVPKVAGDDIETLAGRIGEGARRARDAL